jgi:hypothetical protein
MSSSFTLVDGGKARDFEVEINGDSVQLAEADLQPVLGWELKPEGLCRADTCVPVRDPAKLRRAAGIDLSAVVGALGRPLAMDIAEGVAVVGSAAEESQERLRSLEAPDFSLPDLSGRLHTLSDYRGKKVLLIAYASW